MAEKRARGGEFFFHCGKDFNTNQTTHLQSSMEFVEISVLFAGPRAAQGWLRTAHDSTAIGSID